MPGASFVNIVMSRGRDIGVGRSRRMLDTDDFARILKFDPEYLFQAWFARLYLAMQCLPASEQGLAFYEIERELPLVSARIISGRSAQGSRWATAQAVCATCGTPTPVLVYREENAEDLSAPPDADFGWWYVEPGGYLEDGGIPLIAKAAAMKLRGD